MPRKSWPAHVKSACDDTWLDLVYDVPEREEQVDAFAVRWGGFDVEAFKRALAGNAVDRLFALFALGYLAPPDVDSHLTPFLHSPLRKERWASTIALGRCWDERVLPLLLQLLQEELAFQSPLEVAAGQSLEVAEGERGNMEDLDTDYQKDYDWFFIHRLGIIDFLASWRDPRIIPALLHTLSLCIHIEFRPKTSEIPDWVCDLWHNFQDRLAYVLGQQGAWNAPDHLDLSSERLHILRMYMVYGLLRAKVPEVFYRYYAPLSDLGIANAEQISEALQEHFHLTQEECFDSISKFKVYYKKRETSERSEKVYEEVKRNLEAMDW